MDFGGSLIKLIFFSSGDDDDSASSDVLGSDECEGSLHRADGNNMRKSSPQRPDSPAAQPPQPCLRSGSVPGGSHALPGADEASSPARVASPMLSQGSHSIAEPADSNLNDGSPSSSAFLAQTALQSHPITALNAASRSGLTRQQASALAGVQSHAPVGLGIPAEQDAADPEPRNSMSSSSEKGRQGGKLHFVKFETSRIHDAIHFIEQKQLHRRRNGGSCTDGPLFQVWFLSPASALLLHHLRGLPARWSCMRFWFETIYCAFLSTRQP
jgi:hypothetical protein